MAPSRRLITSILAAALALGLWSPAFADPAPVADNGEILFVRRRADGLFLYRVDPDGSERRAVAGFDEDRSADYEPVGIAPEGRRLAMWHGPPGESRLLVGNADASDLVEIASFGWEGRYPLAAWSPDGREFAVVHRNRLYTVPADGSAPPERRPQNLPVGGIFDLQWHPDGERILLTMDAQDDLQDPQIVWSVDRDGGSLSCVQDMIGLVELGTDEARTLADSEQLGCGAEDPYWAPDGSALLVDVYEYDIGMRIRRVDVGDGQVTKLTDPPESSDSLVGWRPLPDLLAAACPAGSTPDAGFPDTSGSAHERGIDCAAWWEIAAGRTDGTYGPGAPVTRAQMARFLVGAHELAAGRSLPTLPDAFVDDDGIALESSVNAASSVGLTSGVEASRYAPGDAVNRGQMATFLSRLVDRLARDLDLPAR